MSQPEPLTEQQLAAVEAKTAELRERLDRKNPWPSDNESFFVAEGWKNGTRNALDKLDPAGLVAEIRRQRAELAAFEMLAPQQCPAGLHADWLVDSEYAHACPWCQIDRLHTDAAAELMPAWEAVYEPGNVSDYLIGYMNDQDAATGAAEAWMRSQSEVTGRLEWVPWGDVTPMPDGYDRWFELAELHDDGIDTGPGITVRRRKDPAPAPPVAPLAASQPSEAPVEGETATEGAAGRVGDSGADTATDPGWCTFGEYDAPGSGCILPAGHQPPNRHLVTPGDTDGD